nr:hypothetical protein BaRGS_001589 [Batillaria attramentaria]
MKHRVAEIRIGLNNTDRWARIREEYQLKDNPSVAAFLLDHADEDDADVNDIAPELEALLDGVTLREFADMDNDLCTSYEDNHDDWEQRIVQRVKDGYPAVQDKDSDEEEAADSLSAAEAVPEVKFEPIDTEYDVEDEDENTMDELSSAPSTSRMPPRLHSQNVADLLHEGSSSMQTQIREMLSNKSVDSNTAAANVQNVIEALLKKNEDLLAQNDALGFKPNPRRGRVPGELGKHSQVVFPQVPGQFATFSAGGNTQGKISLSGSRSKAQQESASSVPMGRIVRPRSPTRRCSIPEKDKSHFSLALMESKVGDEDSEEIFQVQEHEMVCAVASKTKFLNIKDQVVASFDINFYWCNFCTFSTPNKALLLQHVMDHRFNCKYCRYQSFCRSDVVQHSVHTHPDFQEVAAVTQYCTLLSDYLRVKNPKLARLDSRHKRKRRRSPDRCDDSDQDSGQPPKLSRQVTIVRKPTPLWGWLKLFQPEWGNEKDADGDSAAGNAAEGDEQGQPGGSSDTTGEPSQASQLPVTVSVKQEPEDSDEEIVPIKVRFPPARIQSKDTSSLRSSSGLTFLNHSRDCTPWSKPEARDVRVEPHLMTCLEETIQMAKETQGGSHQQPKSNDDPACTSDVDGDEGDLLSNNNVKTKAGGDQCLYCPGYYYSDTVQEMKDHYLNAHPGQDIVMRDVDAHKDKKASRVYICDQPFCDFSTLRPEELMVHTDSGHMQEVRLRTYQCTSCGWITNNDSSIEEHVSGVHGQEGGAAVVEIGHDERGSTVVERGSEERRLSAEKVPDAKDNAEDSS